LVDVVGAGRVVVGVAVVVAPVVVDPVAVDPVVLAPLLDEADEPLAALELVDVVVFAALVPPVPDLACWRKGLRWRPVSRALLGVVVTLTAGSAGAGTPADPAGGICATGTPPLPPLEISTGTAMRATTSASATGQSRFSRRSEIRLWIMFMA
jgi:hypothetical protein